MRHGTALPPDLTSLVFAGLSCYAWTMPHDCHQPPSECCSSFFFFFLFPPINNVFRLQPLAVSVVRRQANQRGKVAAAPVDGAPMGVGPAGGGGGSNGDDDMPKKKVRYRPCPWLVGFVWHGSIHFLSIGGTHPAQFMKGCIIHRAKLWHGQQQSGAESPSRRFP